MKIKNLKLLVARLEAQLDSPEAARFNMAHFGDRYLSLAKGTFKKFVPVCNTQACLAGETVLALGTGVLLEEGGIRVLAVHKAIVTQATEDLDLKEDEKLRLFFLKSYNRTNSSNKVLGWPEEFEERYLAAKTPQGRLYAAILRVKHFIETKGRE